MKLKAIIWDLGNVFVDWNPEYLFRKLIPEDEKRKYFLENICTNDWNENQDAGYPIKDATDELAQKHPEWKEHVQAYYSRWTEMLGGLIPGTVSVFENLRKSTNLKHYALTNWSAELFPIALERYEFLQWFDGRVVSGEEKMRKPAAEFYQLLLHRYQLQADEVLFIDDNRRNVKAAEALGIKSIVFSSADELETELKKLKVLPH